MKLSLAENAEWPLTGIRRRDTEPIRTSDVYDVSTVETLPPLSPKPRDEAELAIHRSTLIDLIDENNAYKFQLRRVLTASLADIPQLLADIRNVLADF